MSTITTDEEIVGGTTKARNAFAHYFNMASRGRPVTIVAGDKSVTMIPRDRFLELLRRARIGEETAAILADADTMRRLLRSLEDVREGRGVTPKQARQLLGLEEE